MRVHPRRPPLRKSLRLRVSRLDAIPLRPLTARTVRRARWLGEAERRRSRSKSHAQDALDLPARPGLDAVAKPVWTRPVDPLALIAETPWWPASGRPDRPPTFWAGSGGTPSRSAMAARALAREANDPDPDGVARAGLLCRLGCWAVAAVDPEWMARWWHEPGQPARRQREIADLGTDLDDLGRRLAERWGCEPLAVDAAWLHDAHGRRSSECGRRARPAGLYPAKRAAGPNKPPGHSARIAVDRRDARRAPAANPGRRGSSPHGLGVCRGRRDVA